MEAETLKKIAEIEQTRPAALSPEVEKKAEQFSVMEARLTEAVKAKAEVEALLR